ncbi:energy-coupling factor transporter ATPase [Alkalicoccobacillus gibsonii]|uniref:Energy-coupling factor transporter ATPase n=1 Tax=Alkalicoccobacillus gibsonii TaxID=79881 RepID=A0ABU9VD28_9BACI
MAVLLDIQDLHFQYPGASQHVLSGVNVTIEEGEFVALAGRNGSGKSTLARILNGQLHSSSGSILLGGEALTPTNKQAQRRRIGYVFQNPDHQFIGATVWDDLAFGLENHSVHRETMIQRMNYYVRLLRLEDLLHKAPHQLSGGQKQRVGLAGILVLKPDIIILDEATSMLDPKGRHEVMLALKEISNQGITILMITHDMEEVLEADRFIVMHQGSIVADNVPHAVFDDGPLLETTGLKRPFVVELQQELSKAGITFEQDCHSEKELIDHLCKYNFQV